MRAVFPAADWQETTAEAQGIDSRKLADAVADFAARAPRDGADEMVIVRNGILVWKGLNVDNAHGVWSITKTFTSTVLGLLIEDGKVTLDAPVRELLPALDRAYPTVTLRHFTTMTSGYRAVGDEPQGNYRHGPSRTPFEPSDEPLFAPGTKYAYWDSAMNELANALTRAAREPIADLFRRRIAEPIEMPFEWADFGNVDDIVVNGGSGNHDQHVRISARQIARLGLLFLNGGVWNGIRLISTAWVNAATSVQVPTTIPLHVTSFDGRGIYGFNWWTNGIKPNGRRYWPSAPVSTFAAVGANNNRLYVIPAWDTVIVRLGLDEEPDGFEIPEEAWDVLLGSVGRALKG